MKYLLLRGLLVILIGTIALSAPAQKKGKAPKASSNTSWDVNAARPPKAGKKIRVIYKWDLKGTMPGNKCVDDLTWRKGFRYEQVPKSGPGSMTQEGVFLHNLGTKTILFFRNGPFWHMRVKKKIKECQKKTGDYVG